MTRSISRSSTALSSAGVISPLARLLARLLQRGRAQQAADMIGAERRLGALHVIYSRILHSLMPAKAGIQ